MIVLRLPEAVRNRLVQMAIERGMTNSEAVREAIEIWITLTDQLRAAEVAKQLHAVDEREGGEGAEGNGEDG